MLELTRFERDPWSIFDELESLQQNLDRALWDMGGAQRAPGSSRRRRMAFPPLNVWSSEHGIVVDAELPGVDANAIDISVTGDELTIKGKVNACEPAREDTYHRRERPAGEFSRTLQLPFRADGNGVKAAYKNGLLRVTVPRAEEEKPRKIAIEAA